MSAWQDSPRLVIALLLGAGCHQARPTRLVVVSSPLAQTVSLLGDTIYGLPRSGSGGPARATEIAAAREAMARDPHDVNNQLRMARSTAEMGYLREAVNLYSRVAQSRFDDPRVFRDRGELYFRLRQFDAALDDLRQAGLLLIGRGPLLEPGPIGYGPEDGSLELTTTQFQAFFFQGLALYCKGDFGSAAPVLLEAVKQAPATEDRVRAMLWLFYAARRTGTGSEAARVLDLVKPQWIELTDAPELALLLAFKGMISTDTIRAQAEVMTGPPAQLLNYGLAYPLLLKPERRVDAELWLLRVRTGNWDSVPYIVAEAELARLRGGKIIIR